MIDLNHRATLSDEINSKIDKVLEANNKKEAPRNYLGASCIGNACDRALQYMYFHTPKDEDRDFTGRTIRIFARGHNSEDMMAIWIRGAGFDLKTHDSKGKQFGFSILDGKIKGHCDGVFVNGPDVFKYPCLWEAKCINQAGFNKLVKHGLKDAYPVYYAQVQFYQKYFQLTKNPCLFSAMSANTMAIEWQLIEHDPAFTEKIDNRVKMIIMYCDAGELLPRQYHSESFYLCKFCSWRHRCWKI